MTTIKTKPAGSTWTDDQWSAIVSRGEHLLVAAAAGSGKTAVLVERIIRRISDPDDPVDVDRLLVATFTKAAASEMRERIRDALEKALLEQPDSDHLRRQLALIGRASITTLHSFCKDVIGRYFQLIDLDPGFRIANETEADLMRQDLLEELMESFYTDSEADSPFFRLIDSFGGERSDVPLMLLIQKLYDESRSHPKPERWLSEMASGFGAAGQNGSNPWLASLLADVSLELEGMTGLLHDAARICREPGGPEPYLAAVEEELAQLGRLREACGASWDLLYTGMQSAAFGRLKPCKGDHYDKALQEQVKTLRDGAKEQLGKLRTELFTRTPEQYIDELRDMAPIMETLVDLVLRFGELYQQEKAAKGLLDFADLEHYCLRILSSSDSSDEEPMPSQAALDYRSQFVEVLLDEYQDTNRVQDAIVALIAKDKPGNRFMVGDVKQSIYRFRLAEPGLFLEKYRTYEKEGGGAGMRIDLACNFRSRKQVVDAVNFVFKQMMNEAVGEVAYDRSAELVYGANYPETGDYAADMAVELLLLDKSSQESSGEGSGGAFQRSEDGADEEEGQDQGDSPDEAPELETAQMEARTIALQVRKLLGLDGDQPMLVFDKKAGGMRRATFRDVVILLRATQSWAPLLIEELKRFGIPAYAELSTGYFAATEVEAVLSLLKVIDNPFQDIPLAAVLRSSLVGLTGEQLAKVRLARKGDGFFAALLAYVQEPDNASGEDDPIRSRLSRFLEQLDAWRQEARHGALADLIWRIYRETGYYDYVGGLPSGVQRQANLRALYDRARQYEATSFRGLFRFLRFVERMRDGGGDLGTARALGEQEDVVRIMSIHKSKGLEFPVVFVAGLGKMFNQQDLNGSFLLHKDLGFGPRYVDTALRVSYPTLPMLAIRRRMRLETLAEEMRVLYVALTRAREKLFLLGTVQSLQKQLERWGRQLSCDTVELPDHELAKARCYLDWLGPALIRHPHAKPLRELGGLEPPKAMLWLGTEPSVWRFSPVRPSFAEAEAAAAGERQLDLEEKLADLRELRPVVNAAAASLSEVDRRLAWQYPHAEASRLFSKTSVTEMKRLHERAAAKQEAFADDAGWPAAQVEPKLLRNENGTYAAAAGTAFRRPRFMERKQLTGAERGTVYHAVMQHIPLGGKVDEETVTTTVAEMLDKRLLTGEQAEAVDGSVIASFFSGALGKRLLNAKRVLRETPFSYGLHAGEAYPDADRSAAEETVLIQGVIDCLFEDEQGLVLLDYKTDRTEGLDPAALRERYKVQLELYARAVGHIWKRPVSEMYLFFFDGGYVLDVK
ncbi:helicase-exonuclease AddAB subunit AddA [Paenibacillus sp. MBLB4367]|uniref:helicase-exonuclease AddAB subunit AddA n=1 Tax=Paenibacillus sp. MBLB4367 TaxID=3384767 RepID=UPI0039081A1F